MKVTDLKIIIQVLDGDNQVSKWTTDFSQETNDIPLDHKKDRLEMHLESMFRVINKHVGDKLS